MLESPHPAKALPEVGRIKDHEGRVLGTQPQAGDRAGEMPLSSAAHWTNGNRPPNGLRSFRFLSLPLLAALLLAGAVVAIVTYLVHAHDQACPEAGGEIIWADQVTQEEGDNSRPPADLVGQAERLASCGGGQLILIRGAGQGGVQAGPAISLHVYREPGQIENDPTARNKDVQQLIEHAFQAAETVRVPGAGRDVIGLIASVSSELGKGQNTVWLRTLGLPTVNPANVHVLMAADPAQAVASIPGPLPSLHRARVHLVLSPPAGDQPRLNFTTDVWRRQFMRGLLRRADADVVSVTEEETIEPPATGVPPAPIVINLPEPTPHLPGKPQPHKTYIAKLDSSTLFLPNSAVFTISEAQLLAELQPVIIGWRQGLYSHVTVVGHAAKFGSAAGAIPLSQQRAATVAWLLRTHGVSAVTSKGVGFNQPLPPDPRNASNRVVIIRAYPKN